jgi:hypothetical protein
MSLFDAIGGLGAIYGFDKGIKDVQDVGTDALKRAELGATDVETQTQFKPFTVTSGVGGGAFDAQGNLGLTTTPEQQAIQAKLQGFGSGVFDFLDDPVQREQEQTNLIKMLTTNGAVTTPESTMLNKFGTQAFDFLGDPVQREQEQSSLIRMLTGGGTDRGTREAEIMSRLQATQAPEQERARLGLEQRLANQGRLGVQTSMFGGTPEALALEKAIAEQQAGFGVSAMEQARAEQAQQSEQTLQGLQEFRGRMGLGGELGLGSLDAALASQGQRSTQTLQGLQEFRGRMGLGGQLGLDALSSSYQPLEALLATMTPALQGADLGAAGQRQGAQLGTSLLEAGLSQKTAAEAVAGNLRQQQIQAISNLLGGQQANSVTGQTGSTGLIEDLFGSGGMFGGGGGTSSSGGGGSNIVGTPEFQAKMRALGY